MRADERAFLGGVLKFCTVAGFVHTFVEVPLHEYGHYWAATGLGLTSVIRGDRVVWAAVPGLAPFAGTLILLAGGLCAGSLLLVLFAFMKSPYRSGLLPLIASEFVYAPFDGTPSGHVLGLAALVAVWGLVFGVQLAQFWRPGRRSVPGSPRPADHPHLGSRDPALVGSHRDAPRTAGAGAAPGRGSGSPLSGGTGRDGRVVV